MKDRRDWSLALWCKSGVDEKSLRAPTRRCARIASDEIAHVLGESGALSGCETQNHADILHLRWLRARKIAYTANARISVACGVVEERKVIHFAIGSSKCVPQLADPIVARLVRQQCLRHEKSLCNGAVVAHRPAAARLRSAHVKKFQCYELADMIVKPG